MCSIFNMKHNQGRCTYSCLWPMCTCKIKYRMDKKICVDLYPNNDKNNKNQVEA